MEFIRRAAGHPAALAILSGAFNPPTCAHFALAEAGLSVADEVLFVLPRAFPHKKYEGVNLAGRLRMLEVATRGQPLFSVAICEEGLFAGIARECGEAYGPDVPLKILCGRDAAERALSWDYGKAGAFEEMLSGFELWVASRKGACHAPPGIQSRIHSLTIPSEHEQVSATDVRRRIARREPWEHLVPESIVPVVRELYGA